MSSSKEKNDDHPYGYDKGNPVVDEEHECWASDSGSSSGSYYSNSSGSAIEWESEVSAAGEVFHIESIIESSGNGQSDSKATTTDDASNLQLNDSAGCELTRRRSTRAGKLLRLIKRKESYRHSVRLSGLASELKRNHESISKINRERQSAAPDDFSGGEKYAVSVWVDPEKRHKLGRRATICEAYLGIVPRIGSDKSKVLVAGFVPDGEALKDIRAGDWLQSVNSKEVNCHTLDAVLSAFVAPTSVICQFQRNGCEGNYKSLSPTVRCPNQSLLARKLVDKEESKILMDSLIKEPLGVICVKVSEFSEGESDMQGVVYSFPKSKIRGAQSFLSLTKGAYITLNHLLPEIIGPQPVSTTVKTPSGLAHVIYFLHKEDLLLLSFPEKCCSKEEAIELAADVVCCLNFTNENISTCFAGEENHFHLDHFFYLLFSRLCKNKTAANKLNLESIKSSTNTDEIKQCDFSFLLPAVESVNLPRDAQIQIDAALSEMEAMDYRDWNKDPLECQRLYTILGSCLYHRRYLLGSHLPTEDLTQVHSFLRRHGLINLMNSEQVKSLVLWKRIYPASCVNRKLLWEEENVYPLTDKWFLLIVGYGHDLLAVILESGGCTAVLEENSGPDIFYVEEAQDTLKHIRKIGIPMLAEKWINANAKPELMIPQKESSFLKIPSSIADNLVGLIKTNQSKSSSIVTSSSVAKSAHEISNIGKTKTCDESRFDSPVYPFETSRDSPSQDSLSQVSEMSDQAAPILGRRATREKANITAKTQFSDDSDSDLENNQAISDISNIRENLLNQAEYIIPKVITTGDRNSLLYYVHIDLFEGVLISSRLSQLDSEFVSNLNIYSQKIHKLLSDTKRYKKLLSHDAGKSVINKSLIAIKEHGILFEWENCTYWIVGRLYNTPRPKELYICYQDCTPQNLIELAFRLQSLRF
ncbi:protein inturned [Copidosoma floridanum]|uniref:protein inturned n=1 Tax=Copidosoma floridanum TaxID=29053 RepID=UPI0006C947BC|nr:protein inturned [Copidosoma floridanum]